MLRSESLEWFQVHWDGSFCPGDDEAPVRDPRRPWNVWETFEKQLRSWWHGMARETSWWNSGTSKPPIEIPNFFLWTSDLFRQIAFRTDKLWMDEKPWPSEQKFEWTLSKSGRVHFTQCIEVFPEAKIPFSMRSETFAFSSFFKLFYKTVPQKKEFGRSVSPEFFWLD